MTWNERDTIRRNLLENLASHMIRHGEIISDRERSNYYCCIRMVELKWRGIDFLITEVDGETCLIEKR